MSFLYAFLCTAPPPVHHILFKFGQVNPKASQLNRIFEGLDMLENSWNLAHTSEVVKI